MRFWEEELGDWNGVVVVGLWWRKLESGRQVVIQVSGMRSSETCHMKLVSGDGLFAVCVCRSLSRTAARIFSVLRWYRDGVVSLKTVMFCVFWFFRGLCSLGQVVATVSSGRVFV